MGVNDILRIGDKIKKYRKEKGYSQKEFASIVGIPYTTYSNYENNNREPNKTQIEKIVSALEIKIADLMGIPDNFDQTEYDFQKACEWVEDAEVEVIPPNEDDGLQQYILSLSDGNGGEIASCRMDQADIIHMVQECRKLAEADIDELTIKHIQMEIIKNKW